MINNQPLSTRRLQRTWPVFMFVLIAVVSVQEIAAQPGDRRTPEQRRKEMEDRLAVVEQQMVDFPDRLYLYESRGRALTELLRYTEDRGERDSLAERAFADFSTYEKLIPGSIILSRTELHKLVWMSQAPAPGNPELTYDIIQAFRNSPHFDAAVSDYQEMIRHLVETNVSSPIDEEVRGFNAELANLYLFRAHVLARIPDAVRKMNETRLILEDFDQAIEYRKKSVYGTGGIWNVTQDFVQKGEAAYELEEYEIALDAYRAGEAYLNESLDELKSNEGSYPEYMTKSFVDRITLLKAKAYMKTGAWEEVISNLDYYITKGPAYAAECAVYYRMRAQAYRKLGRNELARADDAKARQLPGGLNCN